jgi:DICT domain-containing protein/predicted DNA-binding transcriptional regulator AlpA
MTVVVDSLPGRLLTISDLAERTGVAPATLRSWESRYGFPRPVRLAGGHRRYAEQDVSAVLEVLRHRASGLALEAAVRRGASEPLQTRSLYAELRRQHRELVPQSLTKRTLLALSHAIEDECCARAEQPVLFGGFQRDTFLRESYARWVELARTARVAVVFADISAPTEPGPGLPIEVPLPHEAPLNREWIVVCDAPDLPACMAAVERPGQEAVPNARRRYEAVWTVDPRAVRLASRVAAALAHEYRPELRTTELALLTNEPPDSSADLRRASGLLTRTMNYLDARR